MSDLILPKTKAIPGYFVCLFATWIYLQIEIILLVNLGVLAQDSLSICLYCLTEGCLYCTSLSI